MKSQKTEFFIGIFVCLLDLLVAYGMWISGDTNANIERPVTLFNITLVASLYLMFLLGYLLSFGYLIKRKHQLTKVVGLIMSSAAVLGLSAFFFFGMVALLASLIIIQLVHYIDEKTAFMAAILIPCLGELMGYALGRDFEYPVIIIYGTFNILALQANYRLISEHKAKRKSEQLVRELKATQLLLSATSKRDERLRISRDLHDSLGHQLTALNLQLEVASHVDEAKRSHHMQQAKSIGNTLLTDVRSSVNEFRHKKDFVLEHAIETLTLDLVGLNVDSDIKLDETLIDIRQIEVIFRCVQEAITNVIKHSNATHCDIKLSSDSQTIQLQIQDNGQNTQAYKPGNGLTGMKERVNSLDGSLAYQANEKGFNLTIRLPLTLT